MNTTVNTVFTMCEFKAKGRTSLDRLTRQLGKNVNIKNRQMKCTKFTRVRIRNSGRFL